MDTAAPLLAGAELAGAELAMGLPEEHAARANDAIAEARTASDFFISSFFLQVVRSVGEQVGRHDGRPVR
jgi:hypothetical protein